MNVRIVPANLRDLAYVACNLRPADRLEVECQIDQWDAAGVAVLSLRDYAFIAEIDGNPEAGFGCGQVRQGYWIAWSWSTRGGWRALPTMVRFITGHLQPLVYDDGARRVEARALKANTLAHRFIERIGGQLRCELPAFGKNGEDFVLYDWTRDTWSRQH